MAKGGLSFLFCFFVYSQIKSFVRSTGGNDSGSSEILQEFSTLCPYSSYCQSQPSNVTPSNDVVSCCQKCSCDSKCYEIGNCCPDSPFASAGELKYACVNLSNVSKDNNYDMDTSLWYHVINDCKDSIKDLYYPRCYVPSELQDLIAVSDPENGRVYKNRHCAMCNGVHNYINWTLISVSPKIAQLSFRTFEELGSYVFRNREKYLVYPAPPNKNIGAMSRCFPEDRVINKCNYTGNWDIYEKDVEDACLVNRQGQNVIFIVEHSHSMGRLERFANVYCYLCNKPHHVKKKDLCKATNILGFDRSSHGSFSVLLDIRKNGDSERFRCKSEEIWDHFTRRCRRLSCPGGSIPMNGMCKSFMSHSQGYVIQVKFKVILDMQNVTISYKILLALLERETVPMFGVGCGTGDTYLGNGRNLSDLYFSIGVLPTQGCSPETILTNTRKLAMKSGISYRFKYKDKKIHINLTLSFSNNFLISEILAYQATVRDSLITTEIDSSILFYCPRIRVSDHEADFLGLKSSVNTTADSETVNNLEVLSSNHVCVDVYFGARESVTGSFSSHHFSIFNPSIWFQVLFVSIVMEIIEMHDIYF